MHWSIAYNLISITIILLMSKKGETMLLYHFLKLCSKIAGVILFQESFAQNNIVLKIILYYDENLDYIKKGEL